MSVATARAAIRAAAAAVPPQCAGVRPEVGDRLRSACIDGAAAGIDSMQAFAIVVDALGNRAAAELRLLGALAA